MKNNILSLRKFKNDEDLAKALKANRWLSCCSNSFNVLKKTYGIDFFKPFPINLD